MLEKITEQELAENGVVSAPDKLTGDPAENKKLFDRLITAVLAPHVNKVIQAYNELEAALHDHIDIDPSSVRDNNVSVTEEVKAALGLEGVNPTVKDALLGLGPIKPYLEHWWRRRLATEGRTVIGDVMIAPAENTTASLSNTVHWTTGSSTTEFVVELWSDIRVDRYGTICPGTTETITTTRANAKTDLTQAVLSEKYVRQDDQVYWLPEGTEAFTASTIGGDSIVYLSMACKVDVVQPESAWELLRDCNESAWPRTGVVDSWEYEYLGVPAQSMPPTAQIVRTKYVGTGKYGVEEPNEVILPFVPHVVMVVQGKKSGNVDGRMTAIYGAEQASTVTYGTATRYLEWVTLEWDGRILRWYHDADATYQLNEYNVPYYVVAWGWEVSAE